MLDKNLSDNGKRIELNGKSRFFMNSMENIYFVEKGCVDVFYVPVDKNKVSGRKIHFQRFNSGEIILGLECIQENTSFMLSGVTGTEILEYSFQMINNIFQDEKNSSLINMMEKYVIKSVQRCFQNLLPEKAINVKYGENEYKKNKIIYSDKELKWVKVLSGSCTLPDNQEKVLDQDSHYFPLCKNIYLKTVSEVQMICSDIKSIIDEGNIEESIRSFLSFISESFYNIIKENELEESIRYKQRSDQNKAFTANSLNLLSQVIEKDDDFLFEKSSDDLIWCFKIVAKYMNIDVNIHENNDPNEDILSHVLNSSEIKYRKVKLTGEWWKQDNGPILAFFEEDNKPVAIIPEKPGVYALYIRDEEKQYITKELAASLNVFGYVLYKPFPDKKLNITDLLRFSMKASWSLDKITLILTGVGAGLLAVVVPMVTGKIVDSVIPLSDKAGLFSMALVLITSMVSVLMFNIANAIATIRIEGKTDFTVQAAVWDKLLNMPATFFKDYTSGDLANRTMGINAIRKILSGKTVTTLFSGIFSVFYIILLFYYSKKLALVALGVSLIAIIFSTVLSFLQIKLNQRLIEIEGKISGLVFQILAGIAKFRVSGAENRAFYLWAKEFSDKKRIAFKNGRLKNYIEIFNSGFPVVASMIIFGFLIMKGERNDAGMLTLSTGDFLAFNAAFTAFVTSMINVTMAITSVLEIIPLYQRAKPIIQGDVEVSSQKASPGKLKGRIDVNHISFRYEEEGPLILDDVSFNIDPGEFVAIIGPSGSGKSTLFRLLLGFEKALNGNVQYDYQDVESVDIKAVRRQIGVVLQNGKLLSGDILTNIIGSRNLSSEDAWEAIRASGLERDIKMMPMGIHTVISEGAGTLSGGQKQRLLIAKAIVHKPRILYFDEATSALDNKTQAVVSESIERLKSTRVVIAHRLSTIKNADKIIVLEKGKIVQQGTYDELIDKPGTFQELAKRQLT